MKYTKLIPSKVQQAVICTAFGWLMLAQIGYSQTNNQVQDMTLFPPVGQVGASVIEVENFPRPNNCYAEATFYETSNLNCDTSPGCIGNALNNVPYNPPNAALPWLEAGQTVNFNINQWTSNEGRPSAERIYVYYYKNVGLPHQEIHLIANQFFNYCDNPACDVDMPVSFTAGSGSYIDAIVITSDDLGSYIIPFLVMGPVIYPETPILGTMIAPQIPYLILHDPPGDNSFSSFTENNTICRSVSTSFQQAFGAGITGSAKVGTAGSVGIILEQDFEVSVEFTKEFKTETTFQNGIETEVCIEVETAYNTSALDPTNPTLQDGSDVFIGYGEVLKWGLYDVIEWANVFCSFQVTHQLAYYKDDPATFVLNGDGIRADIDRLEQQIQDFPLDTFLNTQAANQIAVWTDVLQRNQDNKTKAKFNPDPNHELAPVTFQSGPATTYSKSMTTTDVFSMSYNVAVENSFALNVVASIGANGISGGPELSFKKDRGASFSTDNNNTQTISYELLDDDVVAGGDRFECDVYRDPDYGTPIFLPLSTSKSSCPYEVGIRRDQPNISFSLPVPADPSIRYTSLTGSNAVFEADADATVSIILNVCNDAAEARTYRLELENNASQAKVRVANTDINNANAFVDFPSIPAATVDSGNGLGCTPLVYNIEIERGNIPIPGTQIYDYNNLIFKLYPECSEIEAVTAEMTIRFGDGDGDAIASNVDLCPNDRDGALDFQDSGDSAENTSDYVEIPHDPAFTLTDGDFALEAWVYPTNGDHKTIITKGDGLYLSNYIFGIWADGTAPAPGKAGLWLADKNNVNVGQWLFSNSSIVQNQWTHIAVSVDNSGLYPIASFYVNGIADGSASYSIPSAKLFDTDTNPLYIGKQGYSLNSHFFDGKIDDILIWNRQLNEAEVNATMAAPVPSTEAGLVAYYDFNDAISCRSNNDINLIDQGPNIFNGTLHNFALISNQAVGCRSNWISGRNLDSDGDNIGDACDTYELAPACPPSLVLSPDQNTNADYESGGTITSTQTINSPAQVDYDATTEISLLASFEVKAGAIFHAFIDGCGNALRQVKEFVK